MNGLHRHQLLRLNAAGWSRLLAQDWDGEARDGLQHWARHGLPLVVTRQLGVEPGISVGIALPTCWGRRRLALQVDRSEVLYFDEFPCLAEVWPHIGGRRRALLRDLSDALTEVGVTARVYGSFGWQQLTRLRYVHPASDLDLWMAVDSDTQARAAVAALSAMDARQVVRIDGELISPQGTATAWREWQAWDAGRVAQCLVKSIHGPRLIRPSEAIDACS